MSGPEPTGAISAAPAPSGGAGSGSGGFDLLRRATQAMMSRYVAVRHWFYSFHTPSDPATKVRDISFSRLGTRPFAASASISLPWVYPYCMPLLSGLPEDPGRRTRAFSHNSSA